MLEVEETPVYVLMTCGPEKRAFQVLLSRKDQERGPDSRRRARPIRIGRKHPGVGPAGLQSKLLHSQPPASLEGTQLSAKCPRQGTGAGQPRPIRKHTTWLQKADRANHRMRRLPADRLPGLE